MEARSGFRRAAPAGYAEAMRVARSAPLIAAVLGALAACAGPPPGAGGIPGMRISSGVVGIDGSTVQVEAAHQSYDHRVERIALVGPDGRTYPADDTVTETVRHSGYGYGGQSVGVGIGGGTGGHSGVGVGVGLGLGSLGGGSYPVFRTTARIPIPDKDAYRRAPQDWKIAVTVGQRAGGEQVITEPAPTR